MPRPATGAPNGRPPLTSRAQLLSAARSLIDRHGWQSLTIRRLASEAGTSPATVYNHFKDKDELLIQLLNDYADHLPRPALAHDPRERIVESAMFMHAVLADMPWIVEILTADDILGVSAIWMVEEILAGAIQSGCGPDDAVRLYRHIWYYTVGEILVRANRTRRRAEADRLPYRDQVLRGLDHSAFPVLAELADRWTALTAEHTYAEGLSGLLDGLLPRTASADS